MKRETKVSSVQELKERLETHKIAVLANFIGIKAGEANELRTQLRKQGVTFKVYKNRLAKRVLSELEMTDAVQYMDGPTGWAFCDDPVAPAKVLKEFSKKQAKVEMCGAILEGQAISKAQLEALAELPPREALLGQLAGTVAAPLRKLAGALNALPRNLANVIDQVRKQKEESEAA